MANGNVVEIIVRGNVDKSSFSNAQKSVKDVGSTAEATGKKFDELASEAKKSGQSMANMADETEHKLNGLGGKLSSTGKAVGLAGGVAIGSAVAVGFSQSLEFDAAQHKLQAQLGGSAEYSGEMGKLAGDLYSNAYGDSMGAVDDALASVVQSGALMEDATNEQIKSITGQAMSMSEAFGIDVPASMQAVSRMIKTGMVPDAQAGLDLITRAFQQLGPGADDVLDTFTEYSVQFQKIGLDGQESLGMVKQMMDAGARSTDLAADALKEFAIRSINGSKLTADSFKGLGLDATEMGQKFAAGGQTASDAFQLTIDKLKGVKDPVLQSQIAVGLFGTQAEDLGSALYAIDPSKAVAGLGDVAGAAQKVDDAMGSSTQAKIDGMKRSVDQFLAGFVDAPGIFGTAGAAIAAFGGGALTAGSQVAMLAVAMPEGFKKMAMEAVVNFGKMLLSVATYVASSIAGAATSAAAWIAANAAMLLGIGAVVLAIAAVIAIIVLMVKHWGWIKEKAAEVWQAVSHFFSAMKDAVIGFVGNIIDWMQEHWQLILGIIMGPLGILISLVISHWEDIKNIFQRGVEFVLSVVHWLERISGIVGGAIMDAARKVRDGVNDIANWFSSLPNRIWNALGDLAGSFYNAGKNIVTGIWNGIVGSWNWLMGKVSDLASSMLNTALHAIGARSPSKLFADKVGKSIPEGIAVGIESASGVAKAAIEKLAIDELLPTARTGSVARSLWMPTPHGGGNLTGVGRNGMAMGTANPITLKIEAGTSQIDQMLAEILRRYIRVQGGDVQTVLGR